MHANCHAAAHPSKIPSPHAILVDRILLLHRIEHFQQIDLAANLLALQYRPYRFTTNFSFAAGLPPAINFDSIKSSPAHDRRNPICISDSTPPDTLGHSHQYGCTEESIFESYRARHPPSPRRFPSRSD